MCILCALGNAKVAAYTYNESTICTLGQAYSGSWGAGKSGWVWRNLHGDQSLPLSPSVPAGEQMGIGGTMSPLRFRIQSDCCSVQRQMMPLCYIAGMHLGRTCLACNAWTQATQSNAKNGSKLKVCIIYNGTLSQVNYCMASLVVSLRSFLCFKRKHVSAANWICLIILALSIGK